jgi:AAA ATPase domain
MRLSRIEIESFKGIGTPQVIDLKPITLLFGPNSAGKSTILQSLHYLREILERRNADPDQTIAGGLIDLGGFGTLVHGHDLNRAIRLKVCIDLRDDQGSERLPLNSGGSLGDLHFSNLGIRYLVGENTELKEFAIVQDIALCLEARWSDLLQAPYVAKALVEIDGAAVAELHSPAQQGRAHLTALG